MLFEHRFDCRTEGLVNGLQYLDKIEQCTSRLALNKRKRLILTEPQQVDWKPSVVTHNVFIRAHENGEVLWMRSFNTLDDAATVYCKLIGLNLEGYIGPGFHIPFIWRDGELEYSVATNVTFNTTTNNSSLDWSAGGTKCPAGVLLTDWLVVAGGAGGGNTIGGGGGAGGKLNGVNEAVTPGNNYPVTVGALGTGSTSITSAGANGGDSLITGIGGTAIKGTGGWSFSSASSGTGGSGGGASSSGSFPGSLGTSGQGNNGGSCNTNAGGGGGGFGSVGGNTGGPPHGGTGFQWTPTGLWYAAGGGGGARNGSATPGNAASGISGQGNAASAGANASPANRGAGGGGGGFAGASYNGGNGSAGVVGFSFTPAGSFLVRNNSFAHMIVR